MILNLLPEVDLLGEWNLPMEEYFINYYFNKENLKITRLTFLDPWSAHNPWSASLKQKRVLVISPFVKSIRNQYVKRNKLFENQEILPEFTLLTLKAVQTIAGEIDNRFENWFEALEYMFVKAMEIDFDVAIIGCGAYGMPLALKLKKEGKIAIHLGGSTQMMFGVYGQRWENSGLINPHWVKPLEEETPQRKDAVENGCYW